MHRRTALAGLLTVPIAARRAAFAQLRLETPPTPQGAATLAAVASSAVPQQIVTAQAHYASLTRQLAPSVAVTAIPIGPAQDPHTFEPGPAIGRSLARAQLVIQNGLDYDAWLDRLPGPRPRLVIAAILGRHPGDNPHLWYDPTGFEPVTRAIAIALGTDAQLAPTLARFDPIHARIAALRAAHAGTPIAATEPVYALMTKAIGLDMRHTRFQLAIMNGTEPRVTDVAALESDLRQRQVRVLITNSQTAGGITQRIAAVAQRAHVPLTPIAETMPPTLDYQSWIMAGLDALQSALETQ